MGFHSGRVTFCRFRVVGDAPVTVDETVLGTLKDHAFAEMPVAAPDQVEAGFTTGVHLMDTDFTYETNAYGDPAGSLLLFALRIDSHQVPGEIRQAYRVMEELAVASANPSGFASRAQKRDAADAVDHKLHEEIASGKYRRSKTVPVLWDLAGRQIYLGAASNKVMEQMHRLMSEAFNVTLEPLTAGGFAQEAFAGNKRDFEDLSPSAFTAPPKDLHADHEDAEEAPRDAKVPVTPWVHASTNTRDFLGNELAMWLWWRIETEGGVIETADLVAGKKTGRKSRIAVVIDRSLDMECAWEVTGKQSLRGGKPTHLPEAAEALREGKWLRKMGLILADADDETQWELTLQADRYVVSAAALPKAEDATSPRQISEARLLSVLRLAGVIDGLFMLFLDERRAKSWPARRDAMREWIKTRRRRRG